MAWDTTERDLLTRLVTKAATGRPIDGEHVPLFFQVLSACPSLESSRPRVVDEEVCLRALSVAGRSPLDTSPLAEDTLLTLANGSKADGIRDAAAHALADYWTRNPPNGPSSPRSLSRLDALAPSRRFHFALMAGEDEDLEVAATLVSRTDLHIDELKALQQRLLTQDDVAEPALKLLEELYVNGTWVSRRILLRQLGPGHERIVPTLARVTSRADPTTRRAVIAALERIGHVSAEPILVALLSDVEPVVLSEVITSLGRLGTRACLPRLSDLRNEHPKRSRAIDVAFARIDARFPIDARAGAISLSEDGPTGALSLAGANPGDVSLYRDVEQKLSEHSLTQAPQTALSSESHWDRLVTGPRDIPLTFTLRELGVGRWGLSLFAWLVLAATISYSGNQAAMVIVYTMGIITSGVLLAVGSWHYPRRRRALREGTPGYAELIDSDVVIDELGNIYTYTFRYMDELEATHETTLLFKKSMPTLADELLEPTLHPSAGEIMLFDELTYLTVGEDGQFTSKSGREILGLTGPSLVSLAILANVIGILI